MIASPDEHPLDVAASLLLEAQMDPPIHEDARTWLAVMSFLAYVDYYRDVEEMKPLEGYAALLKRDLHDIASSIATLLQSVPRLSAKLQPALRKLGSRRYPKTVERFVDFAYNDIGYVLTPAMLRSWYSRAPDILRVMELCQFRREDDEETGATMGDFSRKFFSARQRRILTIAVEGYRQYLQAIIDAEDGVAPPVDPDPGVPPGLEDPEEPTPEPEPTGIERSKFHEFAHPDISNLWDWYSTEDKQYADWNRHVRANSSATAPSYDMSSGDFGVLTSLVAAFEKKNKRLPAAELSKIPLVIIDDVDPEAGYTQHSSRFYMNYRRIESAVEAGIAMLRYLLKQTLADEGTDTTVYDLVNNSKLADHPGMKTLKRYIAQVAAIGEGFGMGPELAALTKTIPFDMEGSFDPATETFADIWEDPRSEKALASRIQRVITTLRMEVEETLRRASPNAPIDLIRLLPPTPATEDVLPVHAVSNDEETRAIINRVTAPVMTGTEIPETWGDDKRQARVALLQDHWNEWIQTDFGEQRYVDMVKTSKSALQEMADAFEARTGVRLNTSIENHFEDSLDFEAMRACLEDPSIQRMLRFASANGSITRIEPDRISLNNKSLLGFYSPLERMLTVKPLSTHSELYRYHDDEFVSDADTEQTPLHYERGGLLPVDSVDLSETESKLKFAVTDYMGAMYHEVAHAVHFAFLRTPEWREWERNHLETLRPLRHTYTKRSDGSGKFTDAVWKPDNYRKLVERLSGRKSYKIYGAVDAFERFATSVEYRFLKSMGSSNAWYGRHDGNAKMHGLLDGLLERVGLDEIRDMREEVEREPGKLQPADVDFPVSTSTPLINGTRYQGMNVLNEGAMVMMVLPANIDAANKEPFLKSLSSLFSHFIITDPESPIASFEIWQGFDGNLHLIGNHREGGSDGWRWYYGLME